MPPAGLHVRGFAMSPRPAAPGRLGRVRHAGRLEGARDSERGPRVYDGHVLTYVYEGTGHYRDATTDLPLSPGSLVHVFPGHPHWYGAGPDGWSEVFVNFEGPAFTTCLDTGLLDLRHPVRRLEPVSYWYERIDRFRSRRAPLTAAGTDDEVCDLLRLIVEVVARDSSNPPPAQRTGWLTRSQALLTADLGDRLDLPAVAAAVGLPYETWRKRFTAETGSSPARYRVRQRIEAATELMRRTSLSNREIAADLGFSDGHHFARQFRLVTGMSTTQYRQTVR
jgi:AraC-like DNA-binding protein